MTFKVYRDESKIRYGQEMQGGASIEQINCGSLQRIADAAEKMALRHTELIDKAERLEASVKFWRGLSDRKDRQLSAYKGQVTRLRNKRLAP